MKGCTFSHLGDYWNDFTRSLIFTDNIDNRKESKDFLGIGGLILIEFVSQKKVASILKLFLLIKLTQKGSQYGINI